MARHSRRSRHHHNHPPLTPPPRSTPPTAPLNEAAAAAYIGMSPFFLRAKRKSKDGPAFIKMGHSVRYAPRDLDEFLKAHTVPPRPSR